MYVSQPFQVMPTSNSNNIKTNILRHSKREKRTQKCSRSFNVKAESRKTAGKVLE